MTARKPAAKAKSKPKATGKSKPKQKAAPKAKTSAKPKAVAERKVSATPAVPSKPDEPTEAIAKSDTAPKAAGDVAAPLPAEPGAKAESKGRWDPAIVVFACNWCSYAGADTAGVSRIQHQPHFRMIRVMCSGRIQPGFVLRAFEKGADGVLVSGCHFGDCHYVFGNEKAVEQFEKTKNIVKLLGLEEGRVRLEWISAAEGVRFAQVINEFTDQVRELGPSPIGRSAPVDREVPASA